MNIAAHNPKFLNGLSITRLLSRIAILTSQLDGAKKQITTMTSQIMDLTNRCNSADKKNMDLTSQNTAYLQRINELERSATLDSNNSCKPPSSDGLRKPNGKKDKDKKDKDTDTRKIKTRKSGQIVYAKNPAVSPGVNRATKAILSSRLPTRTRLLISCRSNVRIVRPSSHLKIQLVVSTDRFLIFHRLLRLLLSSIVDILANAPDVVMNSRVNFRQM